MTKTEENAPAAKRDGRFRLCQIEKMKKTALEPKTQK